MKYRKYKCTDCNSCKYKKDCTTSSSGRTIQRWVYEDVLHGIESARQGGFKICAVYDEDSKKHWNEICAFADEIRDIRND